MSIQNQTYRAKPLSRRALLKAMGAVVGMSAMAACAPVPLEGAAAPASEAAPTQSSPAPPVEDVTLTFAHHWDAAFQPRQSEFDDAYIERHPGVTIQRTYNTWWVHNQSVPTWAAAQTLPDIIYVHGRYAFPWNVDGYLVSIQGFIDADDEFNVEGILEEALRLYRYDGQQYEIPCTHGPIILGYNKDLFDAGGVEYPNEEWTFDDFLGAATALTDENQWGYVGYQNLVINLANEMGIALVGPWGGEVLDDSETQILLASDESIAALQWWTNLIYEHKVSPLPAEAREIPSGPQMAGLGAMFALPSWSTPTMRQNATFAWDVAPWPVGPQVRRTGSIGSGFGITRDCTHPDAAWEYLSEFLSKEGLEFMWGVTGRGSPARPAAYDSWLESEYAPEHAEYYVQAITDYAVTGRPNRTLAGHEMLNVFNRHTLQIQRGDVTVEQGVAGIIEEGTPLLEAAAARLLRAGG